MNTTDNERFHWLTSKPIVPPERLNNPFDYRPHSLTYMAADAVRRKLADMPQWADEVAGGKMFGVLVCSDAQGKVGFLAAYSGQIGGRADWPWFVPAVFDYLQPDGYFKREEREISDINMRINDLMYNDEHFQLITKYQQLRSERDKEIAAYKDKMRAAKQRRDSLRGMAPEEELIRESQFQKAELRRLKQRWAEAIEPLETKLKLQRKEIEELTEERQRRSEALQRWLFDQFKMVNAKGEERSVFDIFASLPTNASARFPKKPHLPPAGAGECCAPKLLQYAFTHGLRPLYIGEFWQGQSPQKEVRYHDQFYPACRGKCKPILEWMLCDPFLASHESSMKEEINVVYSDDSLLVVDKPSGLLSVPGRSDQPSVESLLRKKYPEVYMVHRLDMDTSGLMVVALTQESYHHLQRQFLEHTVYKQYEALLDGVPTKGDSGTICLPLTLDFLDRPRQLVDLENGKFAATDYRVTGHEDFVDADGSVKRRTSVILTPYTGRTHQLRVHCAHREGLATPIVGDNIYGHPGGGRLFLHAKLLVFDHPKTGWRQRFESPTPWKSYSSIHISEG